jgi:hypothetical protein
VSADAGVEDVVAALRALGLGFMTAIIGLMAIRDVSLADAKQLVHDSAAFASNREERVVDIMGGDACCGHENLDEPTHRRTLEVCPVPARAGISCASEDIEAELWSIHAQDAVEATSTSALSLVGSSAMPSRVRNRSAMRTDGWNPATASSEMPAITNHPALGKPVGCHDMARNVYKAGAQRPPRVLNTSATPPYSPRLAGSMSLAWNAQPAPEKYNSAPVTATCPSQTRKIVTNPAVLWVAMVIRQEATKKTPAMRTERSASEIVLTPREV